MTGKVVKVMSDRGFGFIQPDQGKDLFFHVNDMDRTIRFDATLEGFRVRFDIGEGKRGPVALNVRAER